VNERVLRLFCVLALCGASEACSASALPPLPEALVVIDTDLPIPNVVSDLRLDFYDERWNWFESRDLPRADPNDWPVSFSVYSEDTARDTLVWVRLRLYPGGRVRDYRGERFLDWGGQLVAPATGNERRLLRDGVDVTPSVEPEPLVTVDRLILLRLRAGTRGRARVLLAGACAGTMARLGAPAETCVADERQRQVVADEPLEAELGVPLGSLSGTWAEEPCDAAAADPAHVCIPGGVMLLGTSRLRFGTAAQGERLVRLHRFWIDRYEFTVGRFRNALDRGFSPPEPLGLVDENHPDCTFRDDPQDRATFPLNCVSWRTARAACQFFGGDLPSEAAWEYAAAQAQRPAKSAYPWGNDPPGCSPAIVFGREPDLECAALGAGPQEISGSFDDVTPLGVVGLGGSLAEWCRDSFEDYLGSCWGRSPNTDPMCWREESRARSYRGGSYASPAHDLGTTQRAFADAAATHDEYLGFRCVYERPE
jgi:formylglycine-generating enzyme required for sulfatase activity